MTPAEYREIAKALRSARDELNVYDMHEQTSAITLNQLSAVADHMAKWAEEQEEEPRHD